MRGRVFLGLSLLLALQANGCAGSDENGLTVDVRLDIEARNGFPIRVDIYFVDDCESVAQGTVPESVVASTFQLSDLTTGPPLSNVGPGDYGLYVIARDLDCVVVGAHCDDVTLAEEDEGTLSITVPGFVGAGCSEEEVCVDGSGECVSDTRVDPARDCGDQSDGTACIKGNTSGRCRSESCCTGCWDGNDCHAGDENLRCGVAGAICSPCDPLAEVCETGACTSSTPFDDL